MNTCTTPGHEARARPEHQWICGGCVRRLEEDLASIGALWKELTLTLTRQDVIGGDGGRRGSDVALPFKPGAAEARWVVANVVGTWARLLAEHLGLQAPLNPAYWLLLNATSLAMHPAAGEAVDEIRSAVRLAYTAIDRPPEMLLAGRCSGEDEFLIRCPGVLYARPGDVEVTCPKCEMRHNVEERRQVMLDGASVLYVTKTVALGWVRLLMDQAIPDGTWRSWRTRGRLHVRTVSVEGQELFQFGDVQDLAVTWMARRKVA